MPSSLCHCLRICSCLDKISEEEEEKKDNDDDPGGNFVTKFVCMIVTGCEG